MKKEIILMEDPDGFQILDKYGFIEQPHNWTNIGMSVPEELYAILKIAKEQEISLYQFEKVGLFCRCCGERVELYDWRRCQQETHNCKTNLENKKNKYILK